MPESSKQRQAFDVYWGLGNERSIERLKSELDAKWAKQPGLRTLYEWSRRYHWQARIAELEREARRAADEQRIAALREMYERQAKEGLLLQQVGAEWLAGLPGEQASADAAIRAIVEGAKLERLARGEPSERDEVTTGGSDERFSEYSDAELAHLAELAESLVDRAGEEKPE
jgi:hypothetical protein